MTTMIVGDLHLGKGFNMGKPGVGTALNSRLADQVKLLDWLIDCALEYNVDTLILTGDICEDSKPDYIVVNIFFNFLKKCEIHNLDVHIVIGNHDIKRTGTHYISILDLIETWDFNQIQIHKQVKTIYKSGVCFTLLPFRDRRSLCCDSLSAALELLSNKLPYELADIPTGFDRVLVGHLALEGSLPVGDEIDDYNNELLCPLKMFQGYDYVWMGHIHKPQVRSRKPYIAHIGSLDLSDFGETDHQKIIVLYNPNSATKFKEIVVPSRPLRRIELNVPPEIDTTSYVLEELRKLNEIRSFKDAIVKLDLKLLGLESSNVDRLAVEQYLNQLAVFYVCSFSESRKVAVVPISKQQIIENTIQPKTAIKLYTEQLKFESEEKKSRYLNLATNIIEKYYTSLK